MSNKQEGISVECQLPTFSQPCFRANKFYQRLCHVLILEQLCDVLIWEQSTHFKKQIVLSCFNFEITLHHVLICEQPNYIITRVLYVTLCWGHLYRVLNLGTTLSCFNFGATLSCFNVGTTQSVIVILPVISPVRIFDLCR